MTRTILDLAKPKTIAFDLSNILNPRVNDDLVKISFHIQYDDKPFNMTGYKMYFISADENMGYINIDGMIDKIEIGDNVGNGDVTFTFPPNVFKKAGAFDSTKTMFVVENINSNYIQSTINVSLTVLENGTAKFNADVDQIGYDSKLEEIHNKYKNKAQNLIDELANQVQAINDFSDIKETANQAKQTANDSIAKANAVNNEVTTARSRFSNLNDRLNNQDVKINAAETTVNASQNYSRLDLKNQQQDSIIATKADKDEIDNRLSEQETKISIKANKDELENKLSQMKLYPEAFENVDAIKKAYPDGKAGIFIAVDTGHQWYWVDGAWKDGGGYQAAGIHHTAGLHALTGFVIGAGDVPNFTYERGHDDNGWTDDVIVSLPSTIHVITLTDNDNGKFNRFPITGGRKIEFGHDEYLYVDVQTKTVGTGNIADLRDNHPGVLAIGYNNHGALMSNNIVNLISPNKVLEESMSGWIEPGVGNDVKIIYGNSNDYTIDWNGNAFIGTFPGTYGTNNYSVDKIVSTNEQNKIALPSLNNLIFDKSDNKIKVVSDLIKFIQQGNKNFYYLVYNHYGTLVGPWAKFLNQNYQKVTGNRVYFNTGYTVSFKKVENNAIDLTFDGSVIVMDYASKSMGEKVNLLNSEKTLHIAPTENLVYNKKTKCLEVKTYSDFVKSEDDLIYLLTNQYQELVGPWASYYDKERISKLESEVQSLNSRTAPIPNYYFENDYIDNKVEAIKQANDFVNGVSFFYITDSHFGNNACQAKSLLKYLQSTTNVNTTIFGGDIVRAFGAEDDMNQDVKNYLDLATNSTSNFYALRGNHDLTIVKSESDAMSYSKDDAYTYNIFQRSNELNLTGVPGKNYWYLDNERQKCRFIAVDGFEKTDTENTRSWGVKYFISTEQLKWLANIALNVNEGYKVVIFSHATFDSSLASYEQELLPVKQIVEAFKNKTTAHISNANDSGELDVDFTGNKGEFIASFSGHSHRDQNATTNGILSINTYCDAAYLDDPNYKGNRASGTVNEQCFDAVSINFDLKKITCIRIGAGANEERIFNY